MNRLATLGRALLLALPSLSLVAPTVASQTIVYVKAGATGTNDGTSWNDAYADLQAALQATASGDLWIAAGTYKPAPPGGSRSATFALKDGVALYGGFVGNETSFAQRDPALHPTILSGDLNGDDLPNWVNHYENAYHVVTAAGVGPTAVLDGLVLRAGTADSSWGGGLLIASAVPRVVRCAFQECLGGLGGALAVTGATTNTVSSCSFDGNYAAFGDGGAVYIDTGARIDFENCDFTNNTSRQAGGPAGGGAVAQRSFAGMRLHRCTFRGNSVISPFGGSSGTTGGAVETLGGLVATDCVFLANSAQAGGAVWAGNSNTFVNCVFSGNVGVPSLNLPSAGYGGAIFGFNGTQTVESCVISKNRAQEDGGGIYYSYGSLLLHNSIVWGNTSVNGQYLFQAQVKTGTNTTKQIHYSCVEGLLTPIPGEDPPDPAKFPGCLVVDPQFVDADGPDDVAGTADDDLRLQAISPCIDAGKNAFFGTIVAGDLAGNPRFFDVPAVADTGLGAAPLLDMGAHEFGSQALLPFGIGTPGCLGAHALGASPSPRVDTPTFALTCDKAPPSALGLGLVSNAASPSGAEPFGLGVLLYTDLLASTEVYALDFASDAAGLGTAAAAIPNNPAIAGHSFFAQALWIWTAGCQPSVFALSTSNGLQIVIGS